MKTIEEIYYHACDLCENPHRDHDGHMAFRAGVHLVHMVAPEQGYFDSLRQEITAYMELGIELPVPKWPGELSAFSHFARFCKFTPCPENMSKRKMFFCGIKLGLDNPETLTSVLDQVIEMGNPELGLFDIREE